MDKYLHLAGGATHTFACSSKIALTKILKPTMWTPLPPKCCLRLINMYCTLNIVHRLQKKHDIHILTMN